MITFTSNQPVTSRNCNSQQSMAYQVEIHTIEIGSGLDFAGKAMVGQDTALLFGALLALSTGGVHAVSNSLLSQHMTHGSGLWRFNWSTPACPDWVNEYLNFHAATRGTPDAKYIVHNCPHHRACTYGLGDRMRGLMSTFQLAKAHNRVLLINWLSPDPLINFFTPNTLNWTVTDDLGINFSASMGLDAATASWSTATVGGQTGSGTRVWTIDSNRVPLKRDKVMPVSNTFHLVSPDSHCIMRALFKPTDSLSKATDDVQMQLLGSIDKPFVAVHMRMGHLEGEAKDIQRSWDHFEGLLGAYKCATERDAQLHGDDGFIQTNRLAHTMTSSSDADMLNADAPMPTRPRIVFMTDHEALRSLVASGMLHGMTGPSYVAHHLSQSREINKGVNHINSTMSIFVDFLLLTRAHCLIWSSSGFPTMAMAYAWQRCTAQIEACIPHVFRQS